MSRLQRVGMVDGHLTGRPTDVAVLAIEPSALANSRNGATGVPHAAIVRVTLGTQSRNRVSGKRTPPGVYIACLRPLDGLAYCPGGAGGRQPITCGFWTQGACIVPGLSARVPHLRVHAVAAAVTISRDTHNGVV